MGVSVPTTFLTAFALVVAGLIALASALASLSDSVNQDTRTRLRLGFNRILAFLLFASLYWLFIQFHGLIAEIQAEIGLTPNAPIQMLHQRLAEVTTTEYTVRLLVIVVALAGVCVQLLALRRAAHRQGNAV